MSDFKHQYKNPRLGFGDADHRRYLRAYKCDKTRREVRTRTFDKNRNLQAASVSASPQSEQNISTITDERMKKLIRWKEERNRKKRLESTMKKPAFKVGVVHHSLCSPIIKSDVSITAKPIAPKKTEQSNYIQKRITRATEKRLLAKAAAAKQENTKNLTSVSIKHPTRVKTPISTKKQKSFAPVDYCFKPPSGLQKIPLFGLVPTKQTPQEKYISSETSDDTIKNSESSGLIQSPRLILMQNSMQKLNESIIRNSDGLNAIKLVSSETSDDTIKNSKSSGLIQSPRLILRQDPMQKLNESIIRNSDGLNAIKLVSSKTSDDTIKNSKSSGLIQSPRLILRQDPIQKLNESVVRNSDGLSAIKRTRSSLKEEKKNQTDIQDSLKEDKSSSSSTDIETPPQKITPISSEKENCFLEDLIMFSPYCVRSRGKKNSRKERQQRLGIGRPSDEIPTKDTVMKNLNICVEEEERTAQYFKFILNKETDRLQELCKKWLDIGLDKDIPEDATYEIQQAVGQTNLLINKKFERFRKLVEDCETGKGEMLVTCRDLQGFWDITYMEVKDCDMRFEKLEQRQNRGWQEEEYTITKPAVKKRMPIKKQIASSKPSSLRSLILAARKNKMEAKTSKEDSLQNTYINEKPNNRNSTAFLETNDIRHSARRSKSLNESLNGSKSTPIRRESSKANSVQFSDKLKKMKSPFAAMKISRMCKTPEVQLDDTISYINSDQTPGKSILKKSEELENKETRVKSAHKVNFDDQVVLKEVPLDEEMQTKLDLAAALNIIDSFNLDEMDQSPPINVEKKLIFETEDSDSIDDLTESKPKIQTKKKQNKFRLSVQNTFDNTVYPLDDTSSFIKQSSPNSMEIVSPRKSLRNQIRYKNVSSKKDVDMFSTPTRAIKDEMTISPEITLRDAENPDSAIKILRNRTVLTNTPKRNSKMMTPKKVNVNKEENKSPVKSSRKSLKSSQKNENMTSSKSNIIEEVENVTLIDKRKRSLRKSVAFDETCVVCIERKPVLPMTPHSKRRSKTPSRQRRTEHTQFDEDLISWDTPNKRRSRRIRSQSDNF